jgi:transposase-like protein
MNICPICGGTLTAVKLNGRSAPWLCPPCHRGFWNAELTPEAHAAWRPAHRDHGHHPAIRKAAEVEREYALIQTKGAP